MNKTTGTTTSCVRPDPETLLQALTNFTGDLDRYRHWTRRRIYTPGIQCLAENAGAYWLIDLVASWQIKPEVARENVQVWKLAVWIDRSATAIATGDDQTVLTSQNIPHTDFPLAEFTMWLIDGALMLPGEY